MRIQLGDSALADLEKLSGLTMIPAAELAAAMVLSGLYGAAHPAIADFWAQMAAAKWPQMGGEK
jgi:hypothetical protein